MKVLNIKDVSQVLYEIWDPLDIKALVTPTDEYDDWAPSIVVLVNGGATVEELADALDELLRSMQLVPDRNRSEAAAVALVRLRRLANESN